MSVDRRRGLGESGGFSVLHTNPPLLIPYQRADGKYYAGHPALREPFDAPKDLFRAASLLLGDRIQRLGMKPLVSGSTPHSTVMTCRVPCKPYPTPATVNPQPPPPLSEKYCTGHPALRSEKYYAGHPALRSEKYYTSHSALCEPLDAPKDLFCAGSLLHGDPSQCPGVKQLGSEPRPQSMVVTRRGPCKPYPASATENLPPPPPRSENTVPADAESSLYELVDIISLEELSSASTSTNDSSPASASAPSIYFIRIPDWYQEFYARMDHQGSFHIYPALGGPYHSLQEAEKAINSHLNERRSPSMCREQYESKVEWEVQQCLYYPDGTPKRGPNSPGRKNPNDNEKQLVRALLAQYNDDHNLNEGLAHELKDLVSFMWIYEDNRLYCHFNFTTKTKNPDDGNLFFAEVANLKKKIWTVSCCCMIQPNDNGLCYGCRNNGNVEIVHPNNTCAYIGGHVNSYLPFGGDPHSESDDEDEEALRARLKLKFRGC